MSHPHRTWFRRLERQCEAVRETISAELDGEVSEIEAALARRHRTECADCEQFALSVAHTTDVLRAAPPVQPSRRLMPAPARVVSRGLAVAGFAAAMFVAALLGAGLASRVTSMSKNSIRPPMFSWSACQTRVSARSSAFDPLAPLRKTSPVRRIIGSGTKPNFWA